MKYVDGGKKTMSNARYLMEKHLGRELLRAETVDHIDEDPLNDDLSNLQILSLADNIRRSHRKTEWYEFNCPCCGVFAVKKMKEVRSSWKKGKAGPYCGKSCAGKMHN